MPDAFTPNSDGINDEFLAYGKGIKEFEMKIYNRWGELIFSSDDLLKGWDGKIAGKAAPEGIYAWSLMYNDLTAEKRFKTGCIVLIR